MNNVSIIGRLGADPELRHTPKGTPVAKMSVAVNDRYGENERTYWFPVICWNGLAETVNQYLHKGSRVAVSGRLTNRSYETDDGKRTITEIVAASVEFLDPKPRAETSSPAEPVDEDDIPF